MATHPNQIAAIHDPCDRCDLLIDKPMYFVQYMRAGTALFGDRASGQEELMVIVKKAFIK